MAKTVNSAQMLRDALRSTLVCLALTSGSPLRWAIVGSLTSQSSSSMERMNILTPTLSRAPAHASTWHLALPPTFLVLAHALPQTKAVPLAYLLNRTNQCGAVGSPESPSLDLDELETAFEAAGTVHMGFGFIRGCGLQDFQHSTTAKTNLYSLWNAVLPALTPTILREETIPVKDQLNSDGCNGFTFGITDQAAFTSLMGRTDPALGVVPLKINTIRLLSNDGITLTDPITDVRLYLCRHNTASLEKTFYFM